LKHKELFLVDGLTKLGSAKCMLFWAYLTAPNQLHRSYTVYW